MCDQYEPKRWLAVAKGKCPQCQSGKMFNYPAYNLKKFMDMDATCKVCGLTYEIEPGFFLGCYVHKLCHNNWYDVGTWRIYPLG